MPTTTGDTAFDNWAVIAGSAHALAESLPVQPGRIVTKRLLKASGSRLVLMALDRDQHLTEHTAAVPIFIQLVAGRATVTVEGTPVELEPGGIVRVEQRVPHAVHAHEASHVLLTLLDVGKEPESLHVGGVHGAAPSSAS